MASCDLFLLLYRHYLHSLTFEKKKLLVTFAAFVVFFYSLGLSSAGSGLTGNMYFLGPLDRWGQKTNYVKHKEVEWYLWVTGAEGCWSMVGRETPR